MTIEYCGKLVDGLSRDGRLRVAIFSETVTVIGGSRGRGNDLKCCV